MGHLQLRKCELRALIVPILVFQIAASPQMWKEVNLSILTQEDYLETVDPK
jgi:hypothetical protein